MFSNGKTATDFAAASDFAAKTSWSTAWAVPTAMATVAGVPKASANWAAVVNRSAGSLASAFLTAASTASGTSSRPARGEGCGLVNRWAMTASNVVPGNGDSPTSISKSTQPRL